MARKALAVLPDELTSSEQDVAMKEFMDVSRQALRMGAREVHLVCLESRVEMPASEEEIEEGLVEGIKMHPSLGPSNLSEERQIDGARSDQLHFRVRCAASIQPDVRSRNRNHHSLRHGDSRHRSSFGYFLPQARRWHRNHAAGNSED